MVNGYTIRSVFLKFISKLTVCDIAGPMFDFRKALTDYRRAAKNVQCIFTSRDKGSRHTTACHQNWKMGNSVNLVEVNRTIVELFSCNSSRKLRMVSSGSPGSTNGVSWTVSLLLPKRIYKRLSSRKEAQRVWFEENGQSLAARF